MKRILLATLLSIHSLPAAFTVDFNTPGELAANFSSAQAGPIVQAGDGGLGDSGSLDLSGLTNGAAQQILTLNPSFSGNLSSWNASIYYRGNAHNFWQFGFTTGAAPDIVEGWAFADGEYLPVIFFQSGGADGGAIGFTNYHSGLGNAEFGQIALVPGGLATSAEWYHYSIAVEYLGASEYSVEGTLNLANADGSLGAELATVTSNFINPDLAADGAAYLLLNMYDGVTLDGFSTTAVPEPASAALAGLGLLAGLVFHRRRRA